MLDLLHIAGSLPALPFTVLLGACVLYWGIALASGIDLGTDSVDGAVDGAMDGALDGALDGAVDGVADAAVDGALDGALDGAAEGVADAAVDGAAEGAADAADGSLPSPGLSLLAAVLRLGRVPLTVWVSMFAVWSWLLSYVASWAWLTHFASVPALAVAAGTWAGASILGAGLASISTRPLEPVFEARHGRSRSSLVGEVAEVTTGRVDAQFGQARLQLGGDDLILQIRNDRADNGIERGAEVLVVGFDQAREAFVVEAMAAGTERTRAARASQRAADRQVGR